MIILEVILVANNIIVSSNDRIENSIYEIRVKQVMLDSYLARFFECSNGTKTINQAVGRHMHRFPEDFYFQLTVDSYCDYRTLEIIKDLNVNVFIVLWELMQKISKELKV